MNPYPYGIPGVAERASLRWRMWERLRHNPAAKSLSDVELTAIIDDAGDIADPERRA